MHLKCILALILSFAIYFFHQNLIYTNELAFNIEQFYTIAPEVYLTENFRAIFMHTSAI